MKKIFFLPIAGLMMCFDGVSHAVSVNISSISAGNLSVRVTSLKEARFRTTMRQQYDFSCGSAAVATLLTYHYGHPITEQQIFTAMFDLGINAASNAKDFRCSI